MTPMEDARKRVRNWTSGLLDLSWLGLTELPELPVRLQDLYCQGNLLTRLPDILPASLTTLCCNNNQLTRLPDTLPTGLTELDCSHNRLTRLPDTLPAGLTLLCCSNNQLTTLHDTLPTGLIVLYCSHNHLTTLPNSLPTTLALFCCEYNNFPEGEYNEETEDYVARINAIAETASQERIVQRCALVFEELAQTVWHPSRVERRMLEGVDMEDM